MLCRVVREEEGVAPVLVRCRADAVAAVQLDPEQESRRLVEKLKTGAVPPGEIQFDTEVAEETAQTGQARTSVYQVCFSKFHINKHILLPPVFGDRSGGDLWPVLAARRRSWSVDSGKWQRYRGWSRHIR